MRAAPAALLLAALAAMGCGEATPRAELPRPNVVVIMTDDQTVESMRVMPGVRSSLGAAGTTFSRAYASTALCCPSRATLFTGQYMHNHGVLGNRPPEGGYGRLDTSEYLPVWLQRAGYQTIHIGKFLNRYGQDNPPTEVPAGWSEWYGSVDLSTYQYTGYQLNENGVLGTYTRYQADEYTQRAVDAVGRLSPAAAPFFLSVGYLAPHSGGPREPDDPAGIVTPHPAERHRDLFAAEPLPRSAAFNEANASDKPSFIRGRARLSATRRAAIEENYRQRLESLLAVDEGVVRIVDALHSAGELDNTLIVFTSDNGFFHGEHRVPYGKVMVYEPSVAVPLVMRGPGVPSAARRGQLVTNADLAPTILEAAGASPGRVPDGRSLFGLLRDRGLEWGRELLFEGPTGFDAVAYSALRNQRYLYVEYDTGERELYDMQKDPQQLESRHDDRAYAGVQARLAQRLAALQVCAGASCRTRPRARLAIRRCRPSVSAGPLVRVRVRRRGTLLRARVKTADGRVVTLDRELPAACR